MATLGLLFVGQVSPWMALDLVQVGPWMALALVQVSPWMALFLAHIGPVMVLVLAQVDPRMVMAVHFALIEQPAHLLNVLTPPLEPVRHPNSCFHPLMIKASQSCLHLYAPRPTPVLRCHRAKAAAPKHHHLK